MIPQDTSTTIVVLPHVQKEPTLPSTQDNVTTVTILVKLALVETIMIVPLVMPTNTYTKEDVSLHVHLEPTPTKTPKLVKTVLTHVLLVPLHLLTVFLVLKLTSYT